MPHEALALEGINDRHIDSDCGCVIDAGMDGEAMPSFTKETSSKLPERSAQ